MLWNVACSKNRYVTFLFNYCVKERKVINLTFSFRIIFLLLCRMKFVFVFAMSIIAKDIAFFVPTATPMGTVFPLSLKEL